MNDLHKRLHPGTHLGLALALALIALLVLSMMSLVVLAAGPAYDDADDPAYNPTWDDGDNGGAGFGAWTLSTSSSDAGHYVGSSTANGDGDSNGDGDIDTANSKAWGMFAYNGALAEATRAFTPTAMATGDRFQILLDSGDVITTGSVGFELQNATGRELFAFYLNGDDTTYTTVDDSGMFTTSIPATDEGLDITFILSGTDALNNPHYQLVVAPLVDSTAAYVYSGTLVNALGGQDISQLYLFNDAAGDAETSDYAVFFNAMELIPCTGPQTFTVTNAAQAGRGTLLNAVLAANACAGGTITFDTDVLGSTAVLSAGRELPIERDLAIIGPGLDPNFAADQFTISGEDAHRVFSIAENVTATISGLTIRNGYAPYGGGLLNEGNLTLTDVLMKNNAAYDGAEGDTPTTGGHGGGLYNTGSLMMSGGAIQHNDAGAGSDSVDTSSTTGGGSGGGLYNAGPSTLNDVRIEYNTAGQGGSNRYPNANVGGAGGHGGGIYSRGRLTIESCEVTHNYAGDGGDGGDGEYGGGDGAAGGAGGSGGGIYSRSWLTITQSNFSSNIAGSGGEGGWGGFSLSGVAGNGGSGGAAGNGGAIYNSRAITINDSVFSNNTAGAGGDGGNGGDSDSGTSGNGGVGARGGRGGALFIANHTTINYTADFIRVSFTSNEGGWGGYGGWGGGSYGAGTNGNGGNGGGGGHGGAIFNANEDLNLFNVVAANNEAGRGGNGGEADGGGTEGNGGQGGYGGGVYNSTPGQTEIAFTTFARNFGGDGGSNPSGTYAADGRGGAICVIASGGASDIYVGSSVLGDNARSSSGTGEDCYESGGSVHSRGYNVVENEGNCLYEFNRTGDFLNYDPGLLSSWPYYELDNDSPAIDNGKPDDCPTVDFIGDARDDWRCDSGGYELRYEDSHFYPDPWVQKGLPMHEFSRGSLGPTLISATLTSGPTAGTVRAYKYQRAFPGFGDVGPQLSWKMTAGVTEINPYTAKLDLCYTEDEIGEWDESSLRVYRRAEGAGTWAPVTSTVLADVNCVRAEETTFGYSGEYTYWALANSTPTLALLVDADSAASSPDGLSWATAFPDLQDALDVAQPGNEIWVAEGTYLPSLRAEAAVTRSVRFALPAGVAIYGGFAGDESARDARDWETHVTILSGDIGTQGDDSDNAYRVVTADGVTETAILDGFTISGGRADWYGIPGADYGTGGGMYLIDSSPTLRHLIISDNEAGEDGGGMYNRNSHPQLTDVLFDSNSVSDDVGRGGGMYNSSSDPQLINVVFNGNTTFGPGGGMYNWSSDPQLINVLFSDNLSFDDGGGMYNAGTSAPTLTNCTFAGNSGDGLNSGGMHNGGSTSVTLVNCISWGNSGGVSDGLSGPANVSYSLVEWHESVYPGEGNLNVDPRFVSPATGDYRLQADSPAIDAGDDSVVTVATDLDGNPRIQGAAVDMGAYEDPQPLNLHKTVVPDQDIAYHGIITYTLVLSNTSDRDDADLLLTDTLPSEVSFGGFIGADHGASVANNEITWRDTLTAETALTWVFTATHTGDYGDVVTNTAAFSGTLGVGSAATTFTVEERPVPALSITKSVAPDQDVGYLGVVTYTVTLSNTGAGDEASVHLTDTLPTEVDFGGFIGADHGASVANNEITWRDTLTAETAFTWVFTVTHTGDYGDVVTNTAEFSTTLDMGSDDAAFAVEPNHAPVLTPIGDQAVDQWETLTFTATATDANVNGSLSFSLDAGSVGSITNGGIFIWTPTADESGLYTATVRVRDDGGLEDAETISITVNAVCVPVSGIDLAVTTSGTIYPDTVVNFSAELSPDHLTTPYSYTLDYGDGTAPISSSSDDDPFTFTHAYTVTGVYTATFAAWNCEMAEPVTDSITVTVYEPGVCVEVSGVDLSLLTTGDISPGAQVTWQADISPLGASLPYSYTIDYGDDSAPVNDVGYDNPLQFSHTYTDPATYTVTLSAWNCGMTEPVSATLPVVVHALAENKIYLPLVARNH